MLGIFICFYYYYEKELANSYTLTTGNEAASTEYKSRCCFTWPKSRPNAF